MREVLRWLEENDPWLEKKLRETLERWRDMLSPVFQGVVWQTVDMAPKSLRQEIEGVLK